MKVSHQEVLAKPSQHGGSLCTSCCAGGIQRIGTGTGYDTVGICPTHSGNSIAGDTRIVDKAAADVAVRAGVHAPVMRIPVQDARQLFPCNRIIGMEQSIAIPSYNPRLGSPGGCITIPGVRANIRKCIGTGYTGGASQAVQYGDKHPPGGDLIGRKGRGCGPGNKTVPIHKSDRIIEPVVSCNIRIRVDPGARELERNTGFKLHPQLVVRYYGFEVKALIHGHRHVIHIHLGNVIAGIWGDVEIWTC